MACSCRHSWQQRSPVPRIPSPYLNPQVQTSEFKVQRSCTITFHTQRGIQLQKCHSYWSMPRLCVLTIRCPYSSEAWCTASSHVLLSALDGLNCQYLHINTTTSSISHSIPHLRDLPPSHVLCVNKTTLVNSFRLTCKAEGKDYKWKNHFSEMKGDVGMSLHEK